jgi:hypothetical protein
MTAAPADYRGGEIVTASRRSTAPAARVNFAIGF